MATQEQKELFVRNLRDYLRQRGESITALAERTQISRDTIKSYLSYRNYPRVDKVFLFANHFGITIKEMLATEPVTLPPLPQSEPPQTGKKRIRKKS